MRAWEPAQEVLELRLSLSELELGALPRPLSLFRGVEWIRWWIQVTLRSALQWSLSEPWWGAAKTITMVFLSPLLVDRIWTELRSFPGPEQTGSISPRHASLCV